MQDVLEMDIFDHEAAINVVNKLTTNQGDDYELWLHHLDVMMWSRKFPFHPLRSFSYSRKDEGCVALMGVDNVVSRLVHALPKGTPNAQLRLLNALYTCNQQEREYSTRTVSIFSFSLVLSSLSDDVFDILVSVICEDHTALVRARAMKLLFKTTLDGVFPPLRLLSTSQEIPETFQKRLLTECVFDTLASLLADSRGEVVREALGALKGLLRYR
jgi:hypothetical protein